jgi:hypothetical protein
MLSSLPRDEGAGRMKARLGSSRFRLGVEDAHPHAPRCSTLFPGRDFAEFSSAPGGDTAPPAKGALALYPSGRFSRAGKLRQAAPGPPVSQPRRQCGGIRFARRPRRHAGRRPDVLSIGRFQDPPPSGAGGVSARSGRGGQDQSNPTPVFRLRPWKGWRRMFRSRAGFVGMALRSSSPAQGGRGRWLTALPLTAGYPVLNGPPCT